MLFNSVDFLLFFPIVVLLYWLLPNKARNPFLLVASYYFYMNWEPIYALLIAFTTLTTWGCSLMMSSHPTNKRVFLTANLIINFGILFTFKYLDFFTESVFDALNFAGIRMEVPKFNLLLPVGISFYTFQAIGYTIDVYRGKVLTERNLLTYALFVSFFPQLVAGPIERAANLLPQFKIKHIFDGNLIIEGLKMMIWGYFLKMCIAQQVGPYDDAVFNNIYQHNGTTILFATVMFAFQILGDFGGYSLIAIGTAKCLGFNLMMNFNRPYLSTSVKDFWRRWHISLSSWFAEYVYIPLGGSRCSEAKHQRNIILTMLASGLWHGANWTFVIWGAYHGLLQMLLSLKNYFIKKLNLKVVKLPKLLCIVITVPLVILGWIFFRANSIDEALFAFQSIAIKHGLLYNGDGKPMIALYLLMILILAFKSIKDEFGWNLHFMHHRKPLVAAISTALMIVVILLCARFESAPFIYFQF
ncbi:MAG: MBOAT family protein [Muribaculaceae bacterium]|nr:MBOAT family protein [Muribaculaceae bacterium]